MTHCQNCAEKMFEITSDDVNGVILVKNKKIVKASKDLQSFLGRTLSQFDNEARSWLGYRIKRSKDVKSEKSLI